MLSISKLSLRQFRWDSLILLVTTFWLSTSLVLDFLVMPMMYESGMMQQSGFASTGYSLFWIFNRVEILCAAAILTAILALRQKHPEKAVEVSGSRSRWAMILAAGLLTIPFLYAYLLTPEMSALGVQLGDESLTIPAAMGWMHGLYWGLEVLKLAAASFLLKLCHRDIELQFNPQAS
jgi:hypothetical protein